MILLKDIQKTLSEAIKQSGMTQKDLAELIGVKRPQISCYIHGSKTPSLETFANICDVLDLDANDILCLEDKNK